MMKNVIAVSRMFEYPGIDLEVSVEALLSEYGLEILILTCGVNGSYVLSRENVSFVNHSEN